MKSQTLFSNSMVWCHIFVTLPPWKNNYFIGGNFENAVGIFVGGKKSLLLSIFESETKKNVKNPVKMYDFRVKRENYILTRFFSRFLSFRLKNRQ